jgi:NAD-dependent dihydropyrimidine dehydrogenase PreA subunit
MRKDATFIAVEVDDAVTGDKELAKKLEDACPVDIYTATENGVDIVEANLDECILCGLCLAAAPQGTVTVHKLYSGETLAPAEAA